MRYKPRKPAKIKLDVESLLESASTTDFAFKTGARQDAGNLGNAGDDRPSLACAMSIVFDGDKIVADPFEGETDEPERSHCRECERRVCSHECRHLRAGADGGVLVVREL